MKLHSNIECLQREFHSEILATRTHHSMFTHFLIRHTWFLLHLRNPRRLWNLQHWSRFTRALSQRLLAQVQFRKSQQIILDFLPRQIKFQERKSKLKQKPDCFYDAWKHSLWLVLDKRRHFAKCFDSKCKVIPLGKHNFWSKWVCTRAR